ncbi:hypothetical protein [Methylomonas koyamae]|uniref:hypothetical protein n=1 Tax=Methylomonas koyamae TaxID=702114 RepID=UPI0006D235BF|nr:hypothetical protein [Methylomonas koyamae]
MVSTADANDKAMPTPTLLPLAAPSAVVVAMPVCSALTIRLCAARFWLALRTSASVSLVATVIAAAGEMALPPAAPPLTAVVTVLLDLASNCTAPAPARRDEVSAIAREIVSDTLIATEAPTPTLLSPASVLE